MKLNATTQTATWVPAGLRIEKYMFLCVFLLFWTCNSYASGRNFEDRTKAEFKSYVKEKLGDQLSEQQLSKLADAVDMDGNGTISDSEFANRMEHIKRLSDKKELSYHSYKSMVAQIHQYEKKYPEICKVHDLGVSSDGTTHMWALKISDHVDTEEDEPNVLLTGAIHGNERPAPEMALYTIDHLLNDKTNRKLIDKTQIWVIPIMNTAGHVANTRQNANRVDLNRGFPADWTKDSLDGLEIETTNLIKNFFRKHAHVVAGIDLHTFGQVYLLPYARTREEPADYAAMSVLAERMSQSAGYRSMKLTQFIRRKVKGGGADYRYGKYGTFYYGLELGTSHRPPASELAGLCERNLPGVLIMMNRVHSSTLTGHVTRNGKPVVATISVTGIDQPSNLRVPYRSDKTFGRYYRILLPGKYDVTYELDGKKIIKKNVKIIPKEQTKLDIEFPVSKTKRSSFSKGDSR